MASVGVIHRQQRCIDKQPEMNLVSLGAVANGKSSLVEAMTGKYTPQHSKEQQQGITINLGYAGLKIWKCPNCPEPECYQGTSSEVMERLCHFQHCQAKCELQRHYSIVDCPGHESLMATMLGGAAVMDAGILLMAVNNKMPESQTRDHMIAASVLGAEQFVVCLNKWDLIGFDKVEEKYKEAMEFMEYAGIEKAPIVPIAAKKKINVDVVLEYLCTQLNPVPRDIKCSPLMIVLRSFNNNNPGTYSPARGLIGGILGGALMKGSLKIDDEIEIRPGRVQLNPKFGTRDNDDEHEPRFTYQSIKCNVISLNTEQISLDEAYPGGLIGVKTTLDPALTKNNQLVGSVIGQHGHLPDVYEKIVIKYNLLAHLSGIGKKNSEGKEKKFKKIDKGTKVLLNIHSAQVIGIVTGSPEKKHIEVTFENIPVCIPENQRVPISMEMERKWKLIGSGVFVSGTKSKCLND